MLLFVVDGKLYLMDTQSGKAREILSIAPHSVSAPDGA
jgi:hypothetical protein